MQVKGKHFTVIYTTHGQWGDFVHVEHIKLKKNQKFEAALDAKRISISQVWYVFPGFHDPINSSWGEISEG